MRDRLIELIYDAKFRANCITPTDRLKKGTIEIIADYLLAKGVTIPPVRLGGIVWFYIAHPDKPFELKTGRVFSVEYTLSVKPLLTIRYDDNSLDF